MKLSTYKDERVQMWLTILLILAAVMVVASVVLLTITYAEKPTRDMHSVAVHAEYTFPAAFYVPAFSDLFGGR